MSNNFIIFAYVIHLLVVYLIFKYVTYEKDVLNDKKLSINN